MPSNISQELVEVYGTVDARGQVAQLVIEVFMIPAGPAGSDYGIWPMERLGIMPAIQGQKLSTTRGLK